MKAIIFDLDIKLAIVSSSPSSYVQRVVQHFGWSFDVVVCYHDTTNIIAANIILQNDM